ncbi:MAG: hypothetical protein AAF556_11280 [Pseudomonadota bacterium]
MIKHSDLPDWPAKFTKFLSRGGLTGSPTDGSKAEPKRRPIGKTLRALGLAGAMAVLVTMPGATNKGAAAAQSMGPTAGAVEEDRNRVQQHLDRGVEMTWFHSSVRPMSTVMYFDRNRLTMAIERHGGIDQPAEAKGALPINAFIPVKSMGIRMNIQSTVRMAGAMLDQLPNFKGDDPDPSYHTLREILGQFRGEIPTEPRPIKDIVKDAEFLLQQALVLSEFNDIKFNPVAATAQKEKIKEAHIDALIMDMALNTMAQIEQVDGIQSLELIKRLRPPEQPKQNKDKGMLVSDDGELMYPDMRVERPAKTATRSHTI